MLEIEGLNVGYGEVQVLWDVDIRVKDGALVALVGSNGAGKSTLLKAISGLITPYSGSIRLDGRELTTLRSEQIVSLGITQVPERRRLFPNMSVKENLLMGAYVRPDRIGVRKDLDWIWDLFPVLGQRSSQRAGTLSGGEQQMCAIARGLMSRPQVLLIDEMSLGLAPVIVDRIVDVVHDIHEQGTTLLMVEQDVQLALDNAEYGYVLNTGRIAMEGTARDLLQSPHISSAYLGM